MTDAGSLDVRIASPDDSEEFVFKAETVDRSYTNSVVLRSVLHAAGDVVGRDLDLRMETIDVSGVIQDSDPDTYPSLADAGGYNTATAKEMSLAQAFVDWGPDADLDDPFATLYWGPRVEPGLMTKLQTTEDAAGQRGPGKYTFTLEWSYANIQL